MKALVNKSVPKPAKFARPLVVPVPVQCGDHRCLAYRNKNGIWIDYENGEPLAGRIEIVRKPLE